MTLLPSRKRSGSGHPVLGFRSEMDRLFDDFFGAFMPERVSLALPAVDVSENENTVVVHAEIPGVSAEDLSINADEEALTIRGEKKLERDEKKNQWHITERSSGSFTRVVPLPAPVDAGKAKASFKDGVLSVELPKLPEAKPRKVDIKVE
ncbi:MAG: Hsp20/alpha crystallin family protein [Planctomycetes bacterium]|nr:Hsp20/alpha crystallin family protein [Planctomycetota bacterium]